MPMTVIVLAGLALWLVYALKKIRRGDTGGCGGDCTHCDKDCK